MKKEIERQSKKDPLKAAAALGGALRDPNVRPLLAQAGLQMVEDTCMDTQIVNQVALRRY